MDDKAQKKHLRDAEAKMLKDLRALRRKQRQNKSLTRPADLSRGQNIADQVAATMGSWRFILIQTSILVVWVALNVTGLVMRWDPYPFILLNLALSFQAAYAAPFIMMSQNRQQDIDRRQAENDYRINIKAELEIELMQEQIVLLHSKIDQMREKEVLGLTNTVEELQQQSRAHARLRLELFVDDLAASRRFYTDVLGFSALPGQAEPYMAMRRDGAIVALNDRNNLPADHPVQINPGGLLGKGIEIVLELEDIEAAYRAVVASGWPISGPLQAQSWGLNDFRVVDPDGYYLRLSSAKF
ncbi:DUF1003 domain-containing protein [Devosia rhodophyticola]|uniref:DUF1003 domain-containing protein n=1 Tax=Devosia rhodophyticola TaxID=3026423 RepID=A0ABY7YTS6_9HYPH|nr:DUF1003 domain-containing protein [Devosia rhodophyticola]WDR04709.1 DUF1003 domain-containing protein [Devosia rhodophyticola]